MKSKNKVLEDVILSIETRSKKSFTEEQKFHLMFELETLVDRVISSCYWNIQDALTATKDEFKTEKKLNTIKYARQCSVTGEGMNEGWCFGDGEEYAKYEKDAIKLAKEYGYDSLEEAYDDDACYHTAWEDESEYQYEVIDGVLTEI